ncbi:hypothetical protein A2801_03980 [Candidatus Woesebacteria bacterium RIFCSPHIGHO2_01_FULL_41_10]|uniref:Probable transcriptional regulatory protein A2801_03980 n=1 Tax=Candidatus Woesebacteria bacterium RIFCSPHIGHO2_01_FULL_41_10 TaxID=1802500 RepID=A0A1F7YNV0_9BACT|nr:MAG: hypothetical protein A2801_03980 [Candidatus Woesebacteria bacterium RIFCSPHIGHO2_01_FULL_41_10]
MSGHSKWSTIKRQKAVNDNARGKLFSKLSRGVSVAVKSGGPTPEMNHRLRMAIDAAKAANMPKDTIDRAIAKASESAENLEEVVYEGFGPEGIQVIIEAATDNRNRTSQEVKYLLERSGGTLGGPGAVSFNFDSKGYLLVKKSEDVDGQILALIDLGVDDVEEVQSGIEVYVQQHDLFETKKSVEQGGFEVLETQLLKKPKLEMKIQDKGVARRMVALLEGLDELEDVQGVYMNADIDEHLLQE